MLFILMSLIHAANPTCTNANNNQLNVYKMRCAMRSLGAHAVRMVMR